eukprot:TRINITY_DN3780_c0_g3_i1.p2 TRINITY_DN3780_c0_g3~~TRINITY_DN3780_c0_g3_i1.p2  ORF type:complete len:207 (-),score=23.64 TRINITY_DN3780_c0_g3_i1:315-935(-)
MTSFCAFQKQSTSHPFQKNQIPVQPTQKNRISHVRQFRLSEHPISDWRVDDMVTKAKLYYNDLWTKGSVDLCDKLFADNFVFKDEVWGNDKLVVGVRGMKEYIEGVRKSYPDLWYDIQQVGLASWESVFVLWEASGTFLGYQNGHRAFGHNSHMQGIDYVKFDKQHDKVIAVSQFRQPTKEDKSKLQYNDDILLQSEIKLARLHFE